MALSIVQSAKYQPGSTGNTVAFTLGSSPTAGNILVAFTAFSQYGATRELTAPDGTWTEVDEITSGYDSMSLWWKRLEAGDGTSYTFNISGSDEWRSGVIYEIEGAYADQPIATVNTSTESPTGAITPSIEDALILACINYDNNTLSSYDSGWTLDQSATPSYHQSFGLHRTDLWESGEIDLEYSPTGGISIIVAIGDSAAGFLRANAAGLQVAYTPDGIIQANSVGVQVAYLLEAPGGYVQADDVGLQVAYLAHTVNVESYFSSGPFAEVSTVSRLEANFSCLM